MMTMNISNDRGSKLKIALLSLAVFLVANGVIWAFFGDKFPTFCIVISGFTIVGVTFFFNIRIRHVVSDVQLEQNLIKYSINKNQFEIRRDQISRIGDSGLNSSPHQIIIYLRNGKTVEFFPSKQYGNFYRGELKKILQSWLESGQS